MEIQETSRETAQREKLQMIHGRFLTIRTQSADELVYFQQRDRSCQKSHRNSYQEDRKDVDQNIP